MPKILLGVCGGISAYKTCELVREFQRNGSEVRVIMTSSAQQFVTKLTFESLTRSTVYTDLFGDGAFGTAHIEVTKWADALVVAPLTANTLAHFSHGEASDFLSTLYLAWKGPVILAPAMNSGMWSHPAVQENLGILCKRGAIFVDPTEGELACGDIGIGRMAEPSAIVASALSILEKRKSLQGVNVLVTAGPTREYIDPIRFLSSPSTGEMGLAVAREASLRGANVTVVHGPLSSPVDFQAEWISVRSAEEMSQAVQERLPVDIFVGVAAVADYKASNIQNKKMKKGSETLQLKLEQTTDILSNVTRQKRPLDIVIGFAAETENVVSYARQKMTSKQVDLIVANEVFKEQKGIGERRTTVTFLDPHQTQTHREISKREVAQRLWDRMEQLRQQKGRSHERRRANSRPSRTASRPSPARA